MRACTLSTVVVFFLLGAMPAHAYGDPSGGTLFQVLMPMLAALWAMWMILANRIRKGVTSLYRRLRGAEVEDSAD
jgi:hypothetical protein